VKYALIEAQRGQFNMTRVCRLLAVSRLRYRQLRTGRPSDRSMADAVLDARVATNHAAGKRINGRDRIVRGLHQQGMRVGHKRAARVCADRVCGRCASARIA
jgi:hypothetical protein